MAKSVPLAILLCLNRDKEKTRGIVILDMGMCAENLMLAAATMGIGSVFTGCYPVNEIMDKYRAICGLPANIDPIGLIVLGRPNELPRERKERFNPALVHYNTWQGQK